MSTLFKQIIVLCLSGFFFLAPALTHAQDIFYSKEERFNFQNGDYAVVGHTGEYLFTYTASDKGYFLNAYNDSMALKAKVALDFFPVRTAGAKFISYPDHIIVLYQAEERNAIIQYAAFLDNRALLVGKPIAIDSVKSSWLGNNQAFFRTASSPDKRKIVLYNIDKGRMSATLLDNQLHILHHHVYKLPIKKKESINQTLLDDQGQFYITVMEAVGTKGYSPAFTIYQLDMAGKGISYKKYADDGKYYSGMHSKINRNNGLIYTAGFYSDRKNGNLEGVTYLSYDPKTQSIVHSQNILFGSDLRNETRSNNKKKAFNDTKVRELIIKNDGGFLVIAEDTYVGTRTEMTPGWGYYSWYYAPAYPNRIIREYNYGDLLLLNFDTNGQLIWHRLIRKNQYSQDDNGIFSSYAFLNSGSSLVFLFNDFDAKTNKIEVAAVDGQGEVQIQALNAGDIGNADWLPRKAVQVSKTSWLIPVLNRNNLFFAKVAF